MGLYSPSRNLKVCIHMMKIVPERNGRKIKKVESCSSNNYTSRKVSTELCPEFFLGQSDDATFCSPYMLALN